MRKTFALLSLITAFMLFSGSVSFAGVHSPPAITESKIVKAIFNFEVPATSVVTIIAIANTLEAKLTRVTPVGENSPTLYAEPNTKQAFVPVSVGEVIIGDHRRTSVSNYNSYKRSTDYTLTGYSIAFWRYC